MKQQQDEILIRLFADDLTKQVKRVRFGLQLSSVHYYEEYAGELLDDINGNKTLITLYSGEGVVFHIDFNKFHDIIKEYRKIENTENFIKGRN